MLAQNSAIGLRRVTELSRISLSIAGLDPAGPCFEDFNEEKHLKPTDAVFVDAIHSGARDPNVFAIITFGTNLKRGKLDFYPNWGQAVQPGCDAGGLCSHGRSIALYNWSILNPGKFETKKRITGQLTAEDIVPKETEDIDTPAEMGYYAQDSGKTQEGSFYLETNAAAPYAPVSA